MVEKNKKEDGPVVSVEGKEIPVRDLDEHQRYLYHQIEDLSRKQYVAQSELDQINGSLVYFKNLFINFTKKNDNPVIKSKVKTLKN